MIRNEMECLHDDSSYQFKNSISKKYILWLFKVIVTRTVGKQSLNNSIVMPSLWVTLSLLV